MRNKIPEGLFQKIKKNIPLSCVDAILVNNKKEFFLVKRVIPPYKNKWCLPGGIIKRGQKIHQKLAETAKNELGIKFHKVKALGFYEKIYKERHDISHCFIVSSKNKSITLNFQASAGKFFKKIPKNTAKFHAEMLREAGFS